jgi:hypothetical protein
MKSKKLIEEYKKIVRPLKFGREKLYGQSFFEKYHGQGATSKAFHDERNEVLATLCEAHCKIDDLYRDKIGQWILDDVKNGVWK